MQKQLFLAAFIIAATTISGFKVALDRFLPPLPQSNAISRNVGSTGIPFDREVALALLSSFSSSSDDDAPMTSQGAVYYIGPVTVGSQVFQTIYDTGSNLLWVPGSSCGSACSPHPSYPEPPLGASQGAFEINYLSGSVSGSYFSLPVTLAGADLASFQIGLASSVSFTSYSSQTFDGVFGLGWPSLSGTPSLVPALFSQRKIDDDLFTIFLDPDGGNGELSLGSIDATRYTGPIAYMPLTQQSWWTVNLNGIQVGAQNQIATNVFESAIIDSGSSLIVGPNEAIVAIIDAIESSGVSVIMTNGGSSFFVACNADLPAVNITMSGSDYQQYHFTIPGSALLIPDSGYYCQLALQGKSSSSNFADWIMGDPILRMFYTVYDYGNSRVGLAVPSSNAGSGIFNGSVVINGASHSLNSMIALSLAVALWMFNIT